MIVDIRFDITLMVVVLILTVTLMHPIKDALKLFINPKRNL